MREPTAKDRGRGAPATRPGRAAPARRPRRVKTLVEGGKALARLLMFQSERGLVPAGTPPAGRELTTGQPRARTRAPARARPGPVPAAPLAAAVEDRRRDEAAAAVPVAQGWRPLGPYSIPHGQTYGIGPGSRPAISGRVAAVAVDPANDQHILIGAAGGGVWETKDGGQTWLPRTDGQPSLAIGAIAFDLSNPTTVYAGTGEGDTTFVGFPNLRGAGLLRSTDGGGTWTLHAGDPFVGQGFYDLLVDPEDGTHLFAATTEGLYESSDGGVQWQRRRAHRTWSLSKHPPVPANPAASREVFAACDDGLFRSANGGTSWSAAALPDVPGGDLVRMEARHAPSDGNVVFVFAAYQVSEGDDPTPMLWRRGVAGDPFAAVSPPTDLETGQAWYDWFAAVAPNNPDVLYVGAINAHRGVRQTSGAWVWSNISAKTDGDSIHPDQHAIAFSLADPNVVYIGNDGGIHRSPDAGVAWHSLNRGLCITEIEFLAQHPQYENWVLAGTQDNGTIRYEGEQVWYHVQDGDGGDCAVNAADPYTCYHSFYGMGLERSTTGGAWGSWEEALAVPKTEDYPKGAVFYPPLDVNGNVVARAGKSVYLSTDSGGHWQRKPLPAAAGRATAVTVPSATQVFVATEQGRVFRIDGDAAGWQAPVELARPATGNVSDLLADPTNPNRLWATYSSSDTGGRVYRSDDAGGSWSDVSAGLPDGAAVNAIEIDAAHPDTLWVGVDVGVYRTTNAGGAWTPFSNRLPNVLVKDLLLHPATRWLRAGTQARGVWEIPVDQPTVPDVEVYLRDSLIDSGERSPSPSDVPNPFAKGSQIFWWQSPDIKVDAPPFYRPGLDDLDFEAFADDRSLFDTRQQLEFAAGLMDERPQRGQTVRVYVYVHNRGSKPAMDVAVKVFSVNAAASWPDLPDGFWANFPDNSLPADSPWQAIAPHRVVPAVEPGRGAIVGFEWPVPATVTNPVSLLAIASAGNDEIDTTERIIASLAPNSRKCVLRNLAVVNPSPTAGPTTRAVLLHLWPGLSGAPQTLGLDHNGSKLVRGVVLSKRLAKLAKKAGLERSEPSADDEEALGRLLHEMPELRGRLDLSTAYRGAAAKPWLTFPSATGDQPEPLILLLNPRRPKASGSLVLLSADGRPQGGLTLRVNPEA